MVSKKLSIWTIGHSTLSIEDFIARLNSFEIQLLADVRSYPGSRRYPHFNKENLEPSLAKKGIEYLHFRELGGRRRVRPDSQNVAWRNESFRGYADYMETDEFQGGIARLLNVASERRTAIMCSEAVWWRCHRRFVADYLLRDGRYVFHLMAPARAEIARMNAAAREDGVSLVYPRIEPLM